MKEVIFTATTIFLMIMTVLSVIIGSLDGVMEENPCRYESILARVNVPYMVSCELTKPRFNNT